MKNFQQPITVIDAPCGAGKTEYIIRYMNDHPEAPFLYISPLLSMFDRLKGNPPYEGRGVKTDIFEPQAKYDGVRKTKTAGIKDLVSCGSNIMSTHSLFTILDDEAIEQLQAQGYSLIIDETLDVVTVLSQPDGKDSDPDASDSLKELQSKVSSGDMAFLQKKGCIEIDEGNFNQVKWVDTEMSPELDYRYQDLETLIKTGALSYINDTFLLWHFPIKALEAFANITILTYRFTDSIMRAYLDFYGKTFLHKTVRWEDDQPRLFDFTQDVTSGSAYAPYIHIFTENSKLNLVGNRVRDTSGKKPYPLSSTWYTNKANREKVKTVKRNTENFLRHYIEADPSSVMWTTYKTQKTKVKPRGYITFEQDGKQMETFVPCNCRATEEYIDRYILAYLVDRHMHPGIVQFFAQKGIRIDEGEWALSELIQWMFRSRIRNDKAERRDITIYIPSQRMRALLAGWICEEVKTAKSA